MAGQHWVRLLLDLEYVPVFWPQTDQEYLFLAAALC